MLSDGFAFEKAPPHSLVGGQEGPTVQPDGREKLGVGNAGSEFVYVAFVLGLCALEQLNDFFAGTKILIEV